MAQVLKDIINIIQHLLGSKHQNMEVATIGGIVRLLDNYNTLNS